MLNPVKPKAPDVLQQVRHAHGLRDACQGLEEAHPLWHEPQLLILFSSQSRRKEVLHMASLIEQGHHAIAGSRDEPG